MGPYWYFRFPGPDAEQRFESAAHLPIVIDCTLFPALARFYLICHSLPVFECFFRDRSAYGVRIFVDGLLYHTWAPQKKAEQQIWASPEKPLPLAL